MKIGFIGLGVMGFPMAGHLQSKGFEVSVYNRTATTALRWQDQFRGTVAVLELGAPSGIEFPTIVLSK